MKNLVSIIMPAYNSEKYIKDAILSVLNQSYKNIELIIINDGSTDATEQICQQLLKDNKEILRYFYKKNSGVSETRNYGLKKAKGTYIAFIDSDDIYEPDYIKILLNEIQQNECELVCCSYTSFNHERECSFTQASNIYTNIKDFIEISQKNLLFNQLWNKLYLNEIIQNNKIEFNSKIDLAEDALFNIEYCKYCKKIYNTSLKLYKYRITNSGLGFKYRYDSGRIKLKMYKELENLYMEKKYNLSYVDQAIIKQYISWISNIIDKRNKVNLSQKLKEINELMNSRRYKYDLYLIKKRSESFALKIVINALSSNKYILFLIGKFANIYDKVNKKIIFSKIL